VDDVQWADRVSWFTLRTLIPRLAGLPVVWLFASRDDRLVDALVSDDLVVAEHIRLEPLTTADLIAIAEDILGRPPDATMQRFLDASGGSPFLATQLLDRLKGSADRARFDTMASDFAAAVARRVAKLPGPTRAVVELLAAAGRSLSMADLVALLGEDDAPIEAVTGVLASGLIGMADQVLTFHHDLLREAVLTGVAPTRARVFIAASRTITSPTSASRCWRPLTPGPGLRAATRAAL
jgi:predicted ATPase